MAIVTIPRGAARRYRHYLSHIESSDEEVTLDLTSIVPYADGVDANRAREADLRLGWFVDKVFVLQAIKNQPMFVDCSNNVARWLEPLRYTPWRSQDSRGSAIELSDHGAHDIDLLSRWFKADFPHQRNTLPDVAGLFQVGVAGGCWPPPDSSTFQWRLHENASGIELHWVYESGHRMGNDVQYCVVRKGTPTYSDSDSGGPPTGWTLKQQN
ncbi:MAG: hypothetical protein WBD31_09125 [Rubripirellula sp.]